MGITSLIQVILKFNKYIYYFSNRYNLFNSGYTDEGFKRKIPMIHRNT